MTKSVTVSKKPRKQHSPEFRSEALKLAERIGVAAAARELSLYESQLYAWRSKIQQQKTSSERENELAAENARLKRQLAEQAEELAILQKAATYFCEAPEVKYVFIENHQAVVDRKAETSQNLHHLIAFVAKANKLAPPIWMFFDQQIARRIVFDIVDRNARLKDSCAALSSPRNRSSSISLQTPSDGPPAAS